MYNFESGIETWRQELESSHRLPFDVIEELESHLRDLYEDLVTEFSEQEAFEKSLESLGETRSFTVEFEKLDSLTSIKNLLKNLIIGSTIAILGLMACIAMSGSALWQYWHSEVLYGLVVVSVGITISSFGITRFLKAIHCIVSTKYYSNSSALVLRRWISATYASGIVVWLFGLVQAMSVEDPYYVLTAFKIADSLSAPIYAIIVSEVFLRSTLAKINELVELDV